MLQAVSYTGTENLLSFDELVKQQIAIERWAERNNIELIGSFTDNGWCDTTLDGPAFHLLQDFIRERHLEIDLLLVVSPERFCGSVTQTLTVIKEMCDQSQVKMLCLKECSLN